MWAMGMMVEGRGAAATKRWCSFSLCYPAWRVLARAMWAMVIMVEGRGAAATKR
jgi:hypothetical protein